MRPPAVTDFPPAVSGQVPVKVTSPSTGHWLCTRCHGPLRQDLFRTDFGPLTATPLSVTLRDARCGWENAVSERYPAVTDRRGSKKELPTRQCLVANAARAGPGRRTSLRFVELFLQIADQWLGLGRLLRAALRGFRALGIRARRSGSSPRLHDLDRLPRLFFLRRPHHSCACQHTRDDIGMCGRDPQEGPRCAHRPTPAAFPISQRFHANPNESRELRLRQAEALANFIDLQWTELRAIGRADSPAGRRTMIAVGVLHRIPLTPEVTVSETPASFAPSHDRFTRNRGTNPGVSGERGLSSGWDADARRGRGHFGDDEVQALDLRRLRAHQ